MSVSISSPILEKWLLSGEAIHKNIAVGGAGLTKISVPPGKTFIITKIEMLPFCNIITKGGQFADEQTFITPKVQDLTNILKRIQFQLLFYGIRINSVYNIKNDLFLQVYNNALGTTETTPGINFTKQSFDTFHVVEDDSWLYLKYIDFDEYPETITTDNYQLSFDGSQNWPPTNFYGYTTQSDIVGYAPATGLGAPTAYNYLPTGIYNFASGQDQFILPNPNTTIDPTQTNSFIPPAGDQSTEDLRSTWVPTLPFYNISVIEINRRLSTKGLL